MNGRWRKHKSDLKCQRHANEYLQSSWNKYGIATFKFEEIEVCAIEELTTRESYWIAALNTINRDYGYNLRCDESDNAVSEETKKKISKGRKKWHKENPDKSNSRPVKVVDFNTSPFTWKDFDTVKDACIHYGLSAKVRSNSIFRYIDKKTYKNLAFISISPSGGYDKLKKVYLRWLKINNNAYQQAKPMYAYSLETQELKEYMSRHQFTKQSGWAVSKKNLEMGHKRGEYIVGISPYIIEQRLSSKRYQAC